MTAMNLFVQPQAAYLLTDTAFYLDDGTVTQFAPKVTEVHFGDPYFGPPARMAIASTGVIGPEHVCAGLREAGCRDMVDVLEALPLLVRRWDEALPHACRAPGVTDNSILLSVALCDDADRPIGYLIGNPRCAPVLKGCMSPYVVTATKQYILARGGKQPSGDLVCHDPATFDPLKDGGRLLDDQRLDPFGDDETRFTGIGGQGILTEVRPAGVRYHILRTWNDRVGERIAA